FFSSRRRHTRFSRDWSSDVCSSDLDGRLNFGEAILELVHRGTEVQDVQPTLPLPDTPVRIKGEESSGDQCPCGGDERDAHRKNRSEERRVGKERRSRRDAEHSKISM